ncbi:stage III sporulation protein AF [Pelosinus sp. sgz500959]|uniref:stage III sporulation protein AF n=1 Tax=Pelosinus sp. sgz500959 TaxID=3242472 RepID=UPI00366CED35
MIAAFTSWIKTIIFVVLFASFLELLLPSSSMQRFIRVIMGLFIMLAILNPVIEVAQNYLIPTQVPVLSTTSAQSMVILDHARGTAVEREQLSIETYKKELAQQMKVMIMALDGVADVKVIIDIKSGQREKLSNMIDGIQVYVTPGIETRGVQIAKVSIGESLRPTADVMIELEHKIKKMIIELYQLPKEKIEVKIVHS